MTSNDLLARFLRLPPEQRQVFLRDGALARHTEPIPVRPRPRWPAEFPATPGQRSLYFLWRLAPESSVYHVPMAYWISGPLRSAGLVAALRAVMSRHEALRTTFAEQAGGVIQRVSQDAAIDIAVGEAADREQAQRYAEAAAHQPFDLRRGPLVRLRVWRYGPQSHLVLLVFHHIVVDERSSRIIERELAHHYTAATEGGEWSLPQPSPQYGDYASWLTRSGWQEQRSYWRAQLTGAAPVRMPGHRPRSSGSLTGTTRQARLPGALQQRFGELADHCGVSRFVAGATGFAVFLARWSGQTDLCFGTPVSGRTRAELAGLVGYFLNSVTLRVRIDPAATVAQLAASVRDLTAEAVRHQDLPFHEVTHETRTVRAEPAAPPFTVMFVYLAGDQTPHGLSLGPDLVVTPAAIVPDGAPFDLQVGMVEEPDGTALAFRYATEVHDDDEVQTWLADFTRSLDRLTESPQAPVGTLLTRS